jgi:hypothetical protein
MSKNTYWISDPDGTKALVEGAEERNFWVQVHGWSEADEPQGQEFVWLENDEHGGRAKFNAQAVPLWEPRGWHPSPPQEPVNLALPPERVAAEKAAAQKAATKTTAAKDTDAGSKPTKSAAGASGDEKE